MTNIEGFYGNTPHNGNIDAHKGIKAGVTSTTPIKADTRGIESKLVKLLESTMDRASFDPRSFAYLISLLPSHIQNAYVASFLAYVDTLSHKMTTDTYSDDTEYALCVLGMRIQEGIGRYPKE